MIFRNEIELKNQLKKSIIKSVLVERTRIYNVIQKAVKDYYNDYSPQFYERTYQFLNSLVVTDIIDKGNRISARIYFDYASLDYSTKTFSKFGYNPFNRKDIPIDGGATFNNPKGNAYKVIQSASYGLHGGKMLGRGVSTWIVPIAILHQQFRENLKYTLITNGINVK